METPSGFAFLFIQIILILALTPCSFSGDGSIPSGQPAGVIGIHAECIPDERGNRHFLE
jgi:hypothetical protein